MKPIRLGRKGRPLRIAYGRIFHEANAYSPVPTTATDFERLHALSGKELERASSLRGAELKSFMPHAELTGFRQAAALAGEVDTVPLRSYFGVPGGPLTAECFEWLLEGMMTELKNALPVDGVYLALHGSMQVLGLNRAPEAVILERAREIVGAEVKIAVSYDLHANLSSGMIDPVDILIGYRTNPHWDLAPTGFRAGNRLIRTLRGEIEPVSAWRKLPMVLGGGVTIDFLSPMRKVFRYLRALENDPKVVSASLFMVHPYTTSESLGWAVHVCTNGDQELAERLAEELADKAWAERKVGLPPMLSPEEGIAQARASFLRKLGPVTFVDVGDIVGAGAPGGNTAIAAALIKSGGDLVAYVPIHDPQLVAETLSQPLGTLGNYVLRGTPGYEMKEVELTGTVVARANNEFGRLVRLDIGRTHLVISDRAPLPIHPSFWRAVGLEARDADIIVQKNFFHYRMFYATISFKHLPVVTKGATSLDRVRNGPYVVPTWPNQDPDDWRAGDPILRRGLHGADVVESAANKNLGISLDDLAG